MKKSVGLFLSSEPNYGGVYQYSLSIIKALENLDPVNFKLTCFFLDEKWVAVLPDRFEKVIIRNKYISRVFGAVARRLSRSASGWRFSGSFSESTRVINASDCDVVIYPGQDSLAYYTRKRSIVSIHDLMHKYESHFEEYQGWECANRDLHYSAICKYADLILVDSQIGKEQVLESYRVLDNKVHILPFVPPDYLLNSNVPDVKNKFMLPERFIFYPAQFWEHKNHINLLKALKILIDNGEQINLVLVGSKKNNFSNVISKIEEYGLSKNVFILGYVSNDDMYSLYKSAVAMTFVSLIGPTNIPPMEALITGCPLICSNAYAMPEQVGSAALLVNPKDPIDIAEKIKLIWNDANTRQRLITLGHQQISLYGQSDFTRKLCELIDKTVSTD
jgi:glycosyltransferase involved in cell wall biosynthesis